MANKFSDKLKHAWNAFTTPSDEISTGSWGYGAASSGRPDRLRISISNERSIISSIYTRISIDTAAVDMQHVKLDGNGRYTETVQSGLNNCLVLEANVDQAGRAFKQDLYMTMLDRGVIAVVPVDTSLNPQMTGSYDIDTMRVAEIVQWMPRHVRVSVYNDRIGRREEVTLPKDTVAIIENPFYAVMNEPNSTLQRLTRKLNLLDAVDEASSSGKLDLIIQLPFTVRSEQKKQQAEQRTKDIEMQLKGSKYGIAYADATEKITQLNRPVENTMLNQIEFLTTMLYGQLGLTASVFDGTASEQEMLNYYTRTTEPLLTAVAQGLKRTFLTKTARTQKQSIEFYRDPFKLVAVGALADIFDKLLRNEVLSSNEVRGIIGFKPSSDPKAELLVNSNMPLTDTIAPPI